MVNASLGPWYQFAIIMLAIIMAFVSLRYIDWGKIVVGQGRGLTIWIYIMISLAVGFLLGELFITLAEISISIFNS